MLSRVGAKAVPLAPSFDQALPAITFKEDGSAVKDEVFNATSAGILPGANVKTIAKQGKIAAGTIYVVKAITATGVQLL